MFDLKKLQNTEIKSLNQISSQTVLLSQTVFTQKSRSDVTLGRHYDCTPCTSYGLSCHATWDSTQQRFAGGCSTASMSAGESM